MKVGTLLDRIASEYAAQTRDDETEFTAEQYAGKVGIATRTARDQLRAAEIDGKITSRMVTEHGHRVRLYREAT